MSDKLSARISADIEAERTKHVRLAPELDNRLKTAGFRPTRLAKGLTTYAPVAQPAALNGYLAPLPPGYIVATIDESGMVTIPAGTVQERWPHVADRIRLATDSVRMVGCPVVVLLVDVTPKN